MYAKKSEIEKIQSLAVHKALKLFRLILENEEDIKISNNIIKRVKENWKKQV